jgi:hypothetical protein
LSSLKLVILGAGYIAPHFAVEFVKILSVIGLTAYRIGDVLKVAMTCCAFNLTKEASDK